MVTNSEYLLNLAKATLANQVESGEKNLETKKLLIDQTLGAMNKELEEVQNMISELEKDREAKFGELNEQLRNTAEQTGKLQETTEKLHSALANTLARGQWGERMAEDVLRVAGFIEGINYVKQEVIKASGTRPDYTFLLPRGLKVHMDVKFPMDNYLNYLEADTESSRDKFKNRYLRDVRKRIKEVTKREYIDAEERTINYIIVFIPNEQLFTFISQHDPKVLDDALHDNVILCSPLTLFAVLAVIRQATDNFYLDERTQQVLGVIKKFQNQWMLFSNSFELLGKKIKAAQDEYTTLETTRRNQLELQFLKIDALRDQRENVLELEDKLVVGEETIDKAEGNDELKAKPFHYEKPGIDRE